MTQPSRIGAAVPYLHMIERIRFEESEWPEPDSIAIGVIWKDVDRPDVGGVALRRTDRALAERLRDVIARGDAYENVEIRTDNDGRTYVSVANRFSVVELAQDLDTLDRIGPRAGADVAA